MLRHAFKEWAVICQALATGKQSLILRKGGIAETGGAFAVEHTRFWLYPTYTHQQRSGLKAEALPLLEEVEKHRPPAGILRLSHFAEVLGMYHVRDELSALKLESLHFWSEETVTARFAYHRPGLYVLPVRVFRAKQVHDIPETEGYHGCRTWVELEHGLSTEGATPVLPEDDLQQLQRTLDILLHPTAYA
jgi:hypothetical protein